MIRLSIRLLPAALALALSAALPAVAQNKEPGDLWEVTNEMSMSGMPAGMNLPQRPPQRVCRARTSDKPPVGDNDGRCEMSDTQRSGNAFSWKMRCEGNPPSTGTGEMTYEGRDSYKGTMTMNVSGQTMMIKMVGKRVGECDAGESKRQVAAVQQQAAVMQQQAADARAMQCKGAVDSMLPYMLRAEAGLQCDPKYKTELCRNLQTLECFSAVAPRQPSQAAGLGSGDLKEVGEFCGANVTDLRVRLCKRADEQETLEFLATSCLGYARVDGSRLAKPGDSFGSVVIARECAGRTFSSPPAQQYRSFCTAAARQNLMQPVTADASKAGTGTTKPEEPKEDATTRGKKLLKDIFNR